MAKINKNNITLCIHCAHYDENTGDCRHENNIAKLDFVKGEHSLKFTAKCLREVEDLCGPEGKYFKGKPRLK